jgi:dipeptidyl aminopeptidase/acylaminoacyl peptidase
VLDASVSIREAGTTEWTRLWSITGNESPTDAFVYRQRFVDVSRWTGKRVEFGFRVVGAKGASFGLDDVAIGDFAPAGEFLLPGDTACAAASKRRSASPWRVVTVRQPWAEDVPFETRTDYLRSSSDANNVPGPDSLVARVTIEKRRGYVEVVDLGSGNVRRLPDAWGSFPQWSPDGRYISCVVWKSTSRPHELTVVDVATMTVAVKPELRISGTETRWSPDSRTIAASGVVHDSPRSMLCVVSIPEARVTVIDTVEVFEAHEFSWSPDGRWIAFSRPTRADGHYGTTAAALWIADAATAESWCILDSSEWAEMDPLWITNRSIQITRVRWGDDGPIEERRLVVELSHSAE